MTPLRPDGWKRVRSVFQQALALPAEQRPQFVADVCRDDTLRRHIIALLEAHPRAERFLEAPAVTLLDARIETAIWRGRDSVPTNSNS